jgi:nicotinate-nucleotide adenylyltransferase
VLTHYPPHKTDQKITPLADRIRMVELTIEDNSSFSLSRVDIDRDPPHYALDTVLLLKEKYPRDDLFYLMGKDSLNDLPEWHLPSELVSACNGIAVMNRRGQRNIQAKLLNEIPGLEKKLRFLKTPFIEISSSEIRDRIRRAKEYEYFLPEKVYRYIQVKNLYRS